MGVKQCRRKLFKTSLKSKRLCSHFRMPKVAKKAAPAKSPAKKVAKSPAKKATKAPAKKAPAKSPAKKAPAKSPAKKVAPAKKAAKSPAKAKASPLKKVAKGKVEKKEKKAKAKKDPNAPKRALSAFMFFAKEERPKVLKDNPSFSVPEVGKELGARWGKLADKKKFEALAAKDKSRYEAEMKKYKK